MSIPLRRPLYAGEALLEARTQASVALFKLGAHSATDYAPTRRNPNLEGLKSLRCCCAKGWGAAAALQSICVCAGRALLRGINAHTATAPQGARYTQLEVSHHPHEAGGASQNTESIKLSSSSPSGSASCIDTGPSAVRGGRSRGSWSTWSAVGNLTSRAGELRSASSGPDDRYRVTG